MSQNDLERVRALRTLLTEYDTAKYSIRLPFTQAEIEAQATVLRKLLGDAADSLYKFLDKYESQLRGRKQP